MEAMATGYIARIAAFERADLSNYTRTKSWIRGCRHRHVLVYWYTI